MVKVYGKIETASEMRDLQKKADELGVVAVGVSHKRVPYAFLNGKVTKLAISEVAKYLDVNEDVAKEFVDSKGELVLDEPKVEEVQEVVENTKAEEEAEEEKETSILDKVNVNKILDEMADKVIDEAKKDSSELIDTLKELVAEIKEIKELIYERLI